MMEKVIEVGSWDRMDQPVHAVKVSSRGLIGNDRADFLKIASHVFADAIDSIKVAANQLPIHLNAIGATEGYGPNRNGDGFNEAHCTACHDTFTKLARYYANHKNKDPAKSYGTVKLSEYNKPMRRVELLLFGNMDKAAADEHGGLVMKQATMDKLAKGESVPFSMACRIAHDVCSNCFNKAANRTQYCTEDTCIHPRSGFRGFGCKEGLTKVAGNGFQQYVENPGAQFFDISEVVRNADRIAMGGVADYLEKAASAGHILGGAERAEWWAKQGADLTLLAPEDTIFRRGIAEQVKLARELAEVERQFESNVMPVDTAFARALDPSKQSSIDLASLGSIGSTKMATSLTALAEQKALLSLPAFLHLATGGDAEKVATYSDSVSPHLPGIFGRLIADADLESALWSNKFAHSADRVTSGQRDWAVKQAAACSLDESAVRERVWQSGLHWTTSPIFRGKSDMIKTAAADDPSEALARQYALYKVAFLAAIPRGSDFAQVKRMVVSQNYIKN